MKGPVQNIIVGTPICTMDELGILPVEHTKWFTFQELENDDGEVFLPSLLVKVGLFKNTSEVRRVAKDRDNSKKIKDEREKKLWRTLDGMEFTEFKVGKKTFCLVVGEKLDADTET